jgi:hypothetical protein
MTRRLVGLGLLVVAAFVHVGLTLPARRARDEAREAFARPREQREHLRAQLARLERSSSVARPSAPDGDAAAARSLRRALLDATRGLAIGDVQIATQPQRGGSLAARGRLAGTGRQADVLGVAGRLAAPDSGVVLERVELALRSEGIRLEAEAVSERSGSPSEDRPPSGGGP